MFGELPAYGFFIRHANGVSLSNVEISYLSDEFRPPFVLNDVNGISFNHVNAQKAGDVPTFVLRNVLDFTTYGTKGVVDTHLDRVELKKF